MLHINTNGSYTYTLDNTKASVQALAQCSRVTDVFSYTNSDHYLFTDSANLTISTLSLHDALPILADAASVTEDTNTLADPNPVSGNVLTNDTDVDSGDTHSVRSEEHTPEHQSP